MAVQRATALTLSLIHILDDIVIVYQIASQYAKVVEAAKQTMDKNDGRIIVLVDVYKRQPPDWQQVVHLPDVRLHTLHQRCAGRYYALSDVYKRQRQYFY